MDLNFKSTGKTAVNVRPVLDGSLMIRAFSGGEVQPAL